MSDLSIEKLSQEFISQIKKFDCEDDDLNNFIINDSFHYEKGLLAKTYLLFLQKNLIGYYSILNDKIQRLEDISKREWNKKVKKDLPHQKNFLDELPALKIGRLAINKKFKNNGYGRQIIDSLKESFSSPNNKTGCKFITVDAYKKSQDFYHKQNFKIYAEKLKDKETILMYFNLSQYLKEVEEYKN